MKESIENKTVQSMAWSTVDKIGTLSLSFLTNLILARILLPEDFGSIAMLNVFIAVADIIVHGGFGVALIQNKKISKLDCSSVFYCNLGIAVVLYSLLFLLAPYIADFYDLQLLSPLLRAQALILIINSFSTVQLSLLKRELRFKELALRNIASAIIGLALGLIGALLGLGPWSLVVCSLSGGIVGIILLWRASNWRPSWEFSIDSVRRLFGFGGLLMLSSIISTIYDNIQSLIIGKFFTSVDLGYINQAKKLQGVPAGAISSIVSQVTLPIFSSIQDDNNSLKDALKKNIATIQYINMPLMMLLIIIAEPLINILYGARWVASVPYLQILCVSQLINVINPLNLNIICAKGKGNTYLYIQCLKFITAIGIVLISVRYGLIALFIALSIIPFVEFFLCSFVNKKLIDYGTWDQIKDILPTFFEALLPLAVCFFIKVLFVQNMYVLMFEQIIVFFTAFILLSILFKNKAYFAYLNLVRRIVKKYI